MNTAVATPQASNAIAPANQQNQAVAKKPALSAADTVRVYINSDKFKKDLAMVLPKHMTPDRQARVLTTIITKTPALAKCSQASLYSCMLDCSSLGLEPDGRMAHLIPFGETCTLIVDYKGLIQLIMRSEQVEFIQAFNVHKNDKFRLVYGANPTIEHEPCLEEDRGDYIGSYAVAHLKGVAKPKFEWMPKSEIEGIRARSKTPDKGPWKTDFLEMSKKTTIRRLSKTLPLSYEVREQLDKDTEHEFGDPAIEARFRAAKPAKISTTTGPEHQLTEATGGDDAPASAESNESAVSENTAATAEPKSDPPAAAAATPAAAPETLAGKLSEKCKAAGIAEEKLAAWACLKWKLPLVENISELTEIAAKKAQWIHDNWPSLVQEISK